MRLLTLRLLAVACLTLLVAMPALAKPKTFAGSDDAKEADEPQKFLPDYDKLMEGKDADWVYFPAGSLKSFKSVAVKEFVSNTEGDNEREGKRAAEDGKKYLSKWLKEQGFNVVESGGEVTFEGNVFNAWEPTGGARFWGGWMASPGVGLEVLAKDSGGRIVAEVRQKARGSTVRDAVENGLENVTKALAAGK